MHIFISHSSKNAEPAAKLCERIEAAGHSCFFAPRDIRSGCEYAEEIINGIDCADVVLLLLSQQANDSPHVLREIERAVSRKKPIIVCKLEEVNLSKSMEYFLMTHQWLSVNSTNDFSEIVLRINEYAASHNLPDPAPQENAAAEKPQAGKKTSLAFIAIVACAAIVVAAGIIVPLCLSNIVAKQDIKDQGSLPSITDQSEPSQDNQSTADNTGDASPTESTASEGTSQTDGVEQEVIVSLPNETSASSDTPAVQPENNPQDEPQAEVVYVEIGESLTFGTYNGKPIEWRVLKVSEDGTQAVVVANNILTMKAYDAAEGGRYNNYDGADYWSTPISDVSAEVQRLIRGDNRWEKSNIRTWLNSERENVSYSDGAPTSSAMSEGRNGYHTEAGFLNGFTKEERSAIAETELTTNGTVTRDKVFLLSSEEVQWLYDADVSVYAKPTEAAVEQDKSYWYKVNCEGCDATDFIWWLRDANPDNSCECYCVNLSISDKRIVTKSVGLEGFGIRPAMTIDLTADCLKQVQSD